MFNRYRKHLIALEFSLRHLNTSKIKEKQTRNLMNISLWLGKNQSQVFYHKVMHRNDLNFFINFLPLNYANVKAYCVMCTHIKNQQLDNTFCYSIIQIKENDKLWFPLSYAFSSHAVIFIVWFHFAFHILFYSFD